MRVGKVAKLLFVHASTLSPMSFPRSAGRDGRRSSMSESNKAVVLRWEEQFKNEANVAITDELMAADFVHHLPFPGLPPGRDGLKAAGQGIFASFAHAHLKVTVEACFAFDDRVITRPRVTAKHTGDWLGIPRTGE